ncbi:hypothetical protein LZ30DRAFT_690893 [Colletotrichum cereale]|nr:hypothetical protein LZ30DRAFT_690893 [Colletotrichum cereale]
MLSLFINIIKPLERKVLVFGIFQLPREFGLSGHSGNNTVVHMPARTVLVQAEHVEELVHVRVSAKSLKGLSRSSTVRYHHREGHLPRFQELGQKMGYRPRFERALSPIFGAEASTDIQAAPLLEMHATIKSKFGPTGKYLSIKASALTHELEPF